MFSLTRKISATALVTIALSAALPAHAGDQWCLTRKDGSGDIYSQFESLDNIKNWTTEVPIILLSERSWPECRTKSASCNTSAGDLLTVYATGGDGLKLQRLRVDSDLPLRDVANMSVDPQGRFITGFSPGSDGGFGQQVALYYTGTRHCTDTGLDYPADAQCQFFLYEVFPVGLDQSHRPDLASARWSRARCPVAAQQPSESGGFKPPTP